MLWITSYAEAARKFLRSSGATVEPEDVARLSPLQHKHINVFGRYSFSLDEPIGKGELRPLRYEEMSWPLG